MRLKNDNRFARQSFLGFHAQDLIESCTVGIAGLGGGGSHIAQQLAHVGFMDFVLFDTDIIEDSNLNRTIGATETDVANKTLKIHITERMVKAIRRQARVEPHKMKWQENADALKRCNIVFGCVDGFDERRQLEAFTRRYLIPLIDIGMDVHIVEGSPPDISGQVILSMPGSPCMHCLGFLNEQTLTREAAKYGDAGKNPQVVWCNGVLASTAVGIAVDLVTDWSKKTVAPIYLSYRGSTGTLEPHIRLKYLPTATCPHYPLSQIGEIKTRPL